VVLPTGLLVLPAAGDARFRDLVRKQRLLVLRDLLARTSSDPALKRALPRVQQALITAARTQSHTLLDALGAPDVLPPLLAMMGAQAGADAMLRVAVPALLARLASHRGALEESVLWDVPMRSLALGARVAVFSPDAQGLVANAAGAEIRLSSGAEIRLDALEAAPTGFAIAGLDAHLSLHDANPLAMSEDHPDKQGNAVSLGDRPIDAWTSALEGAVELIRITLPTVHAELALALSRIVPVGYEPERHLSASYREAPGLVYLTLHPSVLTLAEALVHETQHGKLNVLSYFDPVLVNGRTTWTASPVRPDLRPLSGVLLAVHAFVPVAALHARLAEIDHPIARTPELAARRAQVLAGNERGLAIVHELGAPTPIGKEILAALDAVHAATRAASPNGVTDSEALPPG
jgi:HEXXH motif-containing protein